MSNREAAAASERPLPIGWALFGKNGWCQWEVVHSISPAKWADKNGEQRLKRYAEDYPSEAPFTYEPVFRGAPQAVRMLSDDEIWSCECSTYERSALAIQRKFCEVNGIVPLAPQDSTKEGEK